MISSIWLWRSLGSVAVGYVFGMFLTADVVCRAVVHRSAFEVGDGNPGMANVGHELGRRWACVVLVGDCAKVVAAALVATAVCGIRFPVAAAWAGLGATLGHNFPAWHRFRGGKGVATSCATMILVWPLAGVLSCVAGLATVVFGGYLCWGAVVIAVVYELFCVAQVALVPTFGLSALVSAWMMLVSSTGLLALMLWEHVPAVLGIKAGTTPRASLSRRFRRKGR